MYTIYKDFNYNKFKLCKDEYPYLEDTSKTAINCKVEIQSWLKLFLIELSNIGLSQIYDVQEKKIIDIQGLIKNETFFFYSYMNGTEEREYIITEENKHYASREDWCHNHSEDLLLCNDHDGIGIGIVGDTDIFSKINKFEISYWHDIKEEIFGCWS